MKIRIKILLLILLLVSVAVAGMIAGFTAIQGSQIQSIQSKRLDLIMSRINREASEALDAKDDLMLLSYLRFEMRQYREIELGLVTRGGHTSILGHAGADLIYRTTTAGAQGEEPITIQIGFSRAELDGQVHEANIALLRLALAIGAIGLGLGLAGSLWASRKLAGPVARLSSAVEKFGKGDLSVSVDIKGQDEIAVLADSFNRMAANIRESVTAKEDLLSTLTHELNNPLAGLKAYLALLKDPMRVSTLQDTRQAYDTMAEAIGQMELTLSNALELFRTSAKPTIEPELVDLGDIAREVISLYGPVARSNHIDLGLDAPAAAMPLSADRKLLRRVVINLVSNALKYTPARGRITVKLARTETEMLFSVADTGYGISPEDQQHLFTKFYRTRGADGRKTKIPGSGLGLAIAKQAVELHRGRIWVESEKGKGSTFNVSLPMSGSGDAI